MNSEDTGRSVDGNTEPVDGPSAAGESVLTPKRRMSKLNRWLIGVGALVLLLAIVAGTLVTVLLHRAEPLLRASLIDSLQKRFHSRVELDDMHVSVVDGFQVEANGLRIWLPPEAIVEAAPAKPTAATAAGSGDAGSAGQTMQPAAPLPPDSPAAAKWRTQPWIVVGKLRFHASWRISAGRADCGVGHSRTECACAVATWG